MGTLWHLLAPGALDAPSPLCFPCGCALPKAESTQGWALPRHCPWCAPQPQMDGSQPLPQALGMSTCEGAGHAEDAARFLSSRMVSALLGFGLSGFKQAQIHPDPWPFPAAFPAPPAPATKESLERHKPFMGWKWGVRVPRCWECHEPAPLECWDHPVHPIPALSGSTSVMVLPAQLPPPCCSCPA